MTETIPVGWRGLVHRGYHMVFRILAAISYLWQVIQHVLMHGLGRTCPVCGHACRLFQAAGLTRRPDAECPMCGSRERHRFLWRVLEHELDFKPLGGIVFHVAPEPFLELGLRRLMPASHYVSGDLSSSAAMVHLDLTKLPLADAAVDLVICSHVLEHIPDDLSAMREIARVLSSTGTALIVVPMAMGQTREDLSITDPAERAKRYGQEDHVRFYGDDFAKRLELAGLTVTKVLPCEVFTDGERQTYGVPDWVEPIFVGRRCD